MAFDGLHKVVMCMSSSYIPSVWFKPDGSVLACVEKIKVLNENLAELHAMAQDALDDAVLMGATQEQVKQVWKTMLQDLTSAYASHIESNENLPDALSTGQAAQEADDQDAKDN